MNLNDAKLIYKPRPSDGHKGTFGKALMCVGSHGMMGAAVLSTTSCLRSGVGLCYLYGPDAGLTIAQISVPEAIYRTSVVNFADYDAIGVGCGLGRGFDAVDKVDAILSYFSKEDNVSRVCGVAGSLDGCVTGLVIDADALNIIAEHSWQNRLPENAIITPHKVEFERLFGNGATDRAVQIEQARTFAVKHKVIVVLKGAGTAIINADGNVDINTSGNCGMATAGSGDVLTGIITGLLAQGYTPWESARLGVFLHGLSGDIALGKHTEETLLARDIIEAMPQAFKLIIR